MLKITSNFFTNLQKLNFSKNQLILNKLKKFSYLNKYNSFNFSTETKEKSSIELIKILRSETNSPLNHIKRALEDTKNNLEEAKVWLKKKGFKDAENKMSRLAETQLLCIENHEGLVAVSNLTCETDFVANTNIFLDFTKNFKNLIISHKKKIEQSEYNTLKLEDYIKDINTELKGLNINETLKYLISKTGENCQIKELSLTHYEKETEIAGVYLHNTLEESVGKKGSLVILKSESKFTENQRKKLQELADQIAMQIVASKPRYLNKEDIPKEILIKESSLIKEGIMNKKKDASIVSKNEDIDYNNLSEDKLNKLIEKKIENWIESVCLNEQEFVIVDHESKATHENVEKVLTKKAKSFGLSKVRIKEFRSFC